MMDGVMIVLRSVWRRAEGRFSLTVLCLWVAVSVVSLFWTPQPITNTDGYHVWASGSLRHPLGTDGAGADVLSWLMAGSYVDLLIVVATVAFSAILGVALVSAMVARSVMLSSVSVVVVDALISIPTVVLALIVAVPLGASIAVVIVACSIGYGLNLARVARPQALLAARSEYVVSAAASGVTGLRILATHILPAIVPTMAVQLSLSAGTSILAESGLTYLGIGVPSGMPSWGHSLSTSASLVNVYPFAALWPGLVITVVVTALNVFGDMLRDAVDPVVNPRLRRDRTRAGRRS